MAEKGFFNSWGPGINSSLSKMLRKFIFLGSFHIWVSFLKIYGPHDDDIIIIIKTVKILLFGMHAANLFVHNMSSFRGFRKIIFVVIGEMKFCSCTEFWILSKWLTFQADSSLQFL